MKVIVLQGMENTGKTTTMNVVYALLSPLATMVEERKAEGGDRKDFSCILNYKGKIVALFSLGDEFKYIRQAMEEYKDKCDVFICTARTNKGVHRSIKKKCAEECYEYNHISKFTERPEWFSVFYDAKRIILLLDEMASKK